MSGINECSEMNTESSTSNNDVNLQPSQMLNELYTSSTPGPDVPQQFYIMSDRERCGKELQNLVIGEIYCSEFIQDNSASLSSASTPLNVVYSSSGNVPSDYGLIPSEHNFNNNGHVGHFNVSNIFHTSETDSEVALTLASLGEPKNKTDCYSEEVLLTNISDVGTVEDATLGSSLKHPSNSNQTNESKQDTEGSILVSKSNEPIPDSHQYDGETQIFYPSS